MAGKRLLPLLGGSAAVWTTCLVFFQTALLLGYLCAHGIATRVPPRIQAIVYSVLLIISLVQVGLNLNPHPHASTARPIFSVLSILSMLIGLPFLVLSATNPLLQAWYARGTGPVTQIAGEGTAIAETARPPYRLFALSNFGSLLALVVYPALVEPYFSLHGQTLAWSIGFLMFALVCGTLNLSARSPGEETQITGPAIPVAENQDASPAPGERTLWLLMAACGALLLSAVTSHLSQNIAAIPLLWILPLTVYLLTFVIAFHGKFYWRWVMVRLLSICLGGLGYYIATPDKDVPIVISVPL
ncbi:MAG TPA: hypothetical protein VE133_03500, partial [Candidatus Sulfotelmatobacter sp.]|nr:hypothetical protein [Candidatus Sulfotelmatobacter sp.]